MQIIGMYVYNNGSFVLVKYKPHFAYLCIKWGQSVCFNCSIKSIKGVAMCKMYNANESMQYIFSVSKQYNYILWGRQFKAKKWNIKGKYNCRKELEVNATAVLPLRVWQLDINYTKIQVVKLS